MASPMTLHIGRPFHFTGVMGGWGGGGGPEIGFGFGFGLDPSARTLPCQATPGHTTMRAWRILVASSGPRGHRVHGGCHWTGQVHVT